MKYHRQKAIQHASARTVDLRRGKNMATWGKRPRAQRSGYVGILKAMTGIIGSTQTGWSRPKHDHGSSQWLGLEYLTVAGSIADMPDERSIPAIDSILQDMKRITSWYGFPKLNFRNRIQIHLLNVHISRERVLIFFSNTLTKDHFTLKPSVFPTVSTKQNFQYVVHPKVSDTSS